MTTGKTIAIFHDPWRTERTKPVAGRPWRLWRKAMWFKANPRELPYMRTLLEEKFPGAAFIDTDADTSWETQLRDAATVVLLYPDSIGLGFSSIEAKLRAAAPQAAVHVLNGRHRSFSFSPENRRRLRLRRFFETTMLIEAGFAIVLLLGTPLLLAVDFARGRR